MINDTSPPLSFVKHVTHVAFRHLSIFLANAKIHDHSFLSTTCLGVRVRDGSIAKDGIWESFRGITYNVYQIWKSHLFLLRKEHRDCFNQSLATDLFPIIKSYITISKSHPIFFMHVRALTNRTPISNSTNSIHRTLGTWQIVRYSR